MNADSTSSLSADSTLALLLVARVEEFDDVGQTEILLPSFARDVVGRIGAASAVCYGIRQEETANGARARIIFPAEDLQEALEALYEENILVDGVEPATHARLRALGFEVQTDQGGQRFRLELADGLEALVCDPSGPDLPFGETIALGIYSDAGLVAGESNVSLEDLEGALAGSPEDVFDLVSPEDLARGRRALELSRALPTTEVGGVCTAHGGPIGDLVSVASCTVCKEHRAAAAFKPAPSRLAARTRALRDLADFVRQAAAEGILSAEELEENGLLADADVALAL